jgi:hypothetical protein
VDALILTKDKLQDNGGSEFLSVCNDVHSRFVGRFVLPICCWAFCCGLWDDVRKCKV